MKILVRRGNNCDSSMLEARFYSSKQLLTAALLILCSFDVAVSGGYGGNYGGGAYSGSSATASASSSAGAGGFSAGGGAGDFGGFGLGTGFGGGGWEGNKPQASAPGFNVGNPFLSHGAGSSTGGGGLKVSLQKDIQIGDGLTPVINGIVGGFLGGVEKVRGALGGAGRGRGTAVGVTVGHPGKGVDSYNGVNSNDLGNTAAGGGGLHTSIAGTGGGRGPVTFSTLQGGKRGGSPTSSFANAGASAGANAGSGPGSFGGVGGVGEDCCGGTLITGTIDSKQPAFSGGIPIFPNSNISPQYGPPLNLNEPATQQGPLGNSRPDSGLGINKHITIGFGGQDNIGAAIPGAHKNPSSGHQGGGLIVNNNPVSPLGSGGASGPAIFGGASGFGGSGHLQTDGNPGLVVGQTPTLPSLPSGLINIGHPNGGSGGVGGSDIQINGVPATVIGSYDITVHETSDDGFGLPNNVISAGSPGAITPGIKETIGGVSGGGGLPSLPQVGAPTGTFASAFAGAGAGASAGGSGGALGGVGSGIGPGGFQGAPDNLGTSPCGSDKCGGGGAASFGPGSFGGQGGYGGHGGYGGQGGQGSYGSHKTHSSYSNAYASSYAVSSSVSKSSGY